MKYTKMQLGPLETKVLAWSQASGVRIFRTGELVRALKLRPEQERSLFAKMSKRGLLIQLMRGLYLAPVHLPPNKKWVPSQYFLLATLMREQKAEYQVTGLAAFNTYGLSTQIPNVLTVYNTIFSGRRTICGLAFDFIKVDQKRLGGITTFKITEEEENELVIKISSPPRTLVDAIYDYKRFNTLPKAYAWVAERISDRTLMQNFIAMTFQFGNIATKRRIGYLLEALSIEPKLIKPLFQSLTETTSYIPWIPGFEAKGGINKKWGVIINGNIPEQTE